MNPKTYLQIGPYTSVGGVSIHIKRLSILLEHQFVLKFINESREAANGSYVFNLRSKNIFGYLKTIMASDIVHIHTGIWWLRCWHILISRIFGKKVIATIHSLSNLQSKVSIVITKLFLKLTNKTIVVSKEIEQVLKVKNVSILPAFLPPTLKNEPELPKDLLDILNGISNNKIIVSNAFDLILHNGEDLYGLDLLIDVAQNIKNENKNYKIIFILGSLTKNLELYRSYMENIKKEALEKYITIIQRPISFVSLISKSDLVVRATNTDGDAITIREALYLKKPVIASDVVDRPFGTILFKNRDSRNLYLKIDEILQNEKINNADNDFIDNFENNYLNTILENL